MDNNKSFLDRPIISSNGWYISLQQYIFCLGLLLSTNTVFWVNSNHHYKDIILIILYGSLLLGGTISIWNLSIKKQFKVNITLKVILFVILTSILVIYNVTHETVGNLDSLRMTFFLFVVLFTFYEWYVQGIIKAFWKRFVNLVIIFSMISVILWLLSIMGKSATGMTTINWGNDSAIGSLFGLQFFPQGSVIFLGRSLIRNTGIFAEAPMYAFVLSLALIINLFILNKRIRSFSSLVLMFTLISTTSTTGVLIVILSIFIRTLMRLPRWWRLLWLILVPVVGLIIYFVVSQKIQNMGNSVSDRLDDIQAGYHAWKLAPFLGNGLNNSLAIKQFMAPYRLLVGGNDGFSSGIMEILASGGISLFVLWVIVPFYDFAKGNLKQSIVAALILVLLMVTIIDQTYLFTCLIAYFFIAGILGKNSFKETL